MKSIGRAHSLMLIMLGMALAGCIESENHSFHSFSLLLHEGDTHTWSVNDGQIFVEAKVGGPAVVRNGAGSPSETRSIHLTWNGNLSSGPISQKAIEFLEVDSGRIAGTAYGCYSVDDCGPDAYLTWPMNPVAGSYLGVTLLGGQTVTEGDTLELPDPISGEAFLIGVSLTPDHVLTKPKGNYSTSMNGCNVLTGTLKIQRTTGIPVECVLPDSTWTLVREARFQQSPRVLVTGAPYEPSHHDELVMAPVKDDLLPGAAAWNAGDFTLLEAVQEVKKTSEFQEFSLAHDTAVLSYVQAGESSRRCTTPLYISCEVTSNWDLRFTSMKGAVLGATISKNVGPANMTSYDFAWSAGEADSFRIPPREMTAHYESVKAMYEHMSGMEAGSVSVFLRVMGETAVRVGVVFGESCATNETECSTIGSQQIYLDLDNGRHFLWENGGSSLRDYMWGHNQDEGSEAARRTTSD